MRIFSTGLIGAALALSGGVAMAQSGGSSASANEYDCKLFDECGDQPVGVEVGATKQMILSRTLPQDAKAGTPAAKVAEAARAPASVRTTTAAKPRFAATSNTASGNAASSNADLELQFVSGSAELLPEAKLKAMKLSQSLLKPGHETARLLVEGHTDAVGDRGDNKTLSLARAQAVVDFLVSEGVEASRFDIQGYGSDRPLPGLSPFAGKNRRVEGHLLLPKSTAISQAN